MIKISKITFILVIAFSYSSCSINQKYIDANCNFSPSREEPERCFHGIGDRCKGVPLLANMQRNFNTCYVDGFMSIGSILHDSCCELNKHGYRCAYPDKGTKVCKTEWDIAVKDSLCSFTGNNRQWQYQFGPYYLNNKGDDLDKKSYAPSGQRVNIEYSDFCKNGCSSVYGKDSCGDYCVCK